MVGKLGHAPDASMVRPRAAAPRSTGVRSVPFWSAFGLMINLMIGSGGASIFPLKSSAYHKAVAVTETDEPS